MNKRRAIGAVGVAVAISAGAVGAGAAFGGGNEDDERASGPAADRAARVALERFPGASVTAVERDPDGGPPWEVELRRSDGTTVDVELDGRYRIVATDEDRGPDDDEADDDDRDDDDRADDDRADDADDADEADDDGP